MFARLNRPARWAAALFAVGAMCRGTTTTADVPSYDSAQGVRSGAPDASADPKREKMVKTFSRQLGRLKPVGTSKKDLDDFYVIGTAELNRVTGHADVRFQVTQGQQEVAEFLVGYILGASKQSDRKWHVFSRLKDAPQAEQALAFTRMQYDRLASYREDLKKRYQATTIRRR